MEVTIYRLENAINQGPFTGRQIYQYVGTKHSDPSQFSNPYNDGISWADWEFGVHFCGCESLRQLLKWFPANIIRTMRKVHKFGIAVYRVDDRFVLFGGKQVMFVLSEARLVEFK